MNLLSRYIQATTSTSKFLEYLLEIAPLIYLIAEDGNFVIVHVDDDSTLPLRDPLSYLHGTRLMMTSVVVKTIND